MAGDTIITVVGNLTSDPELRFTPSGTAVATFTVASTPRSFDKQSNEWKDGDTLFIRCDVWREFAENVAETLTKGMRVICQGRLVVRTYERNDGSRGTSVELKDCEVGPSLRYATAQVKKSQRIGGGTSGYTANTGGSASAETTSVSNHTFGASNPTTTENSDDPWNTGAGNSSPFDNNPPF